MTKQQRTGACLHGVIGFCSRCDDPARLTAAANIGDAQSMTGTATTYTPQRPGADAAHQRVFSPDGSPGASHGAPLLTSNEQSNYGIPVPIAVCAHVARRPGGDLTRISEAPLAPCPWCEIERLRAALGSAVLMVNKLKVFGADNVQRYDVEPWLKKVRERFPNLPNAWPFTDDGSVVETKAPENMHSDEWWQAELDRCVAVEQAKYRALFDAYRELKNGDPDVTAGVRPSVEETSALQLTDAQNEAMDRDIMQAIKRDDAQKAT